MNCPVCKEAMLVLELDQVEVDHCVSCGGVWLDRGELELLLGESQWKELLMRSLEKEVKTKEKKRKCPICSKKMEKISCGRQVPALLDRCGRGDGLWCDAGELQTMIKQTDFDQTNRILHLLQNMFSVKQ